MTTSRIISSETLVLFADLQEGIANLPLTISPARLKKGVRNLAKLAKLFDMPVIVTAVPGPDGKAQIMPEIAEELGPLPTHFRSTADSFLNDPIAERIKSSGRKTILISGVATELAVQLPALTGVDLGYRTFVVVDACGGTSERTEQAALSRIVAHGGSTVSVMTLAGECAGDFREPKAQAAIGILFDMAQPETSDSGLSLAEMKQFVRNHFEDFVNRKKSEVALRNFSADFLDHDEPMGEAIGPEAAKTMMEAAYKRWPDLHVTVEEILAEGDKVLVRNSWTGTEAATGQKIEFHGFVLWRFSGKKIVERWATLTPPKTIAGA
jgi:nicotinamidase-related amidase/predicted ester cyclase